MAPETPSPENQKLERAEAEILAKHAATDQAQTSSALRRLPLVIGTVLLVVLLLRWLS